MHDDRDTKNLTWLCQMLHKNNVQYLIVGGTAVNIHGYYRPSTESDGTLLDNPDFDFWFNPTYPNYLRLLDALMDMGLDIADIREEEYPSPKRSFFRFKLTHYSLDFIPTVGGGLLFRDSYKKRVVSVIDDTEITIIALDDLLTCKKATGRKKDLEDIAALQAKHNG